MRTPEDEAWEEMERRQGGGFPAKRRMAADKFHWSDCAVHNAPAYPAGKCDCDARLSKYAETLLEDATRSCNNIDEQRALDALMREAQPAQEQPVHMEMPEPEGWYCYDHDYPYEGHKYHTVEQIQKIVTAAVEAERKALAQPAQEPVAKAWNDGYKAGVADERTSEANIGIAGFGAKIKPARQNPYGVAQPAQEPWPDLTKRDRESYQKGHNDGVAHHKQSVKAAQPPKHTWVGLTDDELANLWYKESLDWMEFARAHEAALKEKNNG